MALTAAQRRKLSRRTTASSRRRLMQTFTGGQPGQVYTPQQQAIQQINPAMRPITPGAPPQAAQPPQAGTPARATAQFVPDAQYLAGAAQKQFERQTQLDQIQAQDEAERNQTQEAIRRLTEGAPDQRQQTAQTAAKQGLFYSGQLGKRLGDLETQIARQRADFQTQYDTNARAREVARSAILRGAPLDDAADQAAAVERQLGRDADAAAARRLVPTVVKPKPKKKKKAKK